MIKLRLFLIRLLAGQTPIAINIKHYSDGLDMGARASISENIEFKEGQLFQ